MKEEVIKSYRLLTWNIYNSHSLSGIKYLSKDLVQVQSRADHTSRTGLEWH
jgi:hypothetical protein